MGDATTLLETSAPGPPPDRGRLLTPKEVAELVGGSCSEAWVRRNVPHKITLGHSTVRWYESDVLSWLEERREG